LQTPCKERIGMKFGFTHKKEIKTGPAQSPNLRSLMFSQSNRVSCRYVTRHGCPTCRFHVWANGLSFFYTSLVGSTPLTCQADVGWPTLCGFCERRVLVCPFVHLFQCALSPKWELVRPCPSGSQALTARCRPLAVSCLSANSSTPQAPSPLLMSLPPIPVPLWNRIAQSLCHPAPPGIS